MATKPSDKLDWVSDNDPTKIDEPDSGKKLLGWVAEEKPPYQWFNWLFNNVTRWFNYFEETTDDQAEAITDIQGDIVGLESELGTKLNKDGSGLSADINLGASYGIISTVFKSRSTYISTGGVIRLANSESIMWRNNVNAANVGIRVSTNDRLQFETVDIPTISSTDTLTNKTISAASNTITGLTKTDVGLGNVDNTSDATKNSASVTLTNKTISGASNTLTVRLASDVSGTLPIGNGGTGQTTANAALNAFLPSQTGNSGKFLTSDGSNSSWGTPFTSPMSSVGDLIYGASSGAATRLAPNTTTTNKFLRGTGTGSAGQAPSWEALAQNDIPLATDSGRGAVPIYVSSTFSPTIIGSTGSYTTVTYSVQNGIYTRIGDLVTFSILLRWTNTTGTATGGLMIAGLPYTSKNVVIGYTVQIATEAITLPTGTKELRGIISNNDTRIQIYEMENAGSFTAVSANNGGSATRTIYAAGSYFV